MKESTINYKGNEYIKLNDVLSQSKELGLTKKYIKENLNIVKIKGNSLYVKVDEVTRFLEEENDINVSFKKEFTFDIIDERETYNYIPIIIYKGNELVLDSYIYLELNREYLIFDSIRKSIRRAYKEVCGTYNISENVVKVAYDSIIEFAYSERFENEAIIKINKELRNKRMEIQLTACKRPEDVYICEEFEKLIKSCTFYKKQIYDTAFYKNGHIFVELEQLINDIRSDNQKGYYGHGLSDELKDDFIEWMQQNKIIVDGKECFTDELLHYFNSLYEDIC